MQGPFEINVSNSSTAAPAPEDPSSVSPSTRSDNPAGNEPPKRSRTERRECAALDALRTLFTDLYTSQSGGLPAQDSEMDFTLRIKARPQDNWALRFDPGIAEQVISQMQDQQACKDVFMYGHAYCFRCNSSNCEHSQPATPLSVFKGYSSTGVAEWIDFSQALINARHDRVDLLFGRAAPAMALVQLGAELKSEQLSSFGRASKTYALLGQTIAGYFTRRDKERFAVTFQIVETRGDGGKFGLQLNTLTDEGPDGFTHPMLVKARNGAWREVRAMEHRVQMARQVGSANEQKSALCNVPHILRRLAETIENGGRFEPRNGMRSHAHPPAAPQRARPAAHAREDALTTAAAHIFYDEQSHAYIFCGPQGRTHAYQKDGRHINSFILPPGVVEMRLRAGRWRVTTSDEADAIQTSIKHPQGSTPHLDQAFTDTTTPIRQPPTPDETP